jgi:hypothetical protein
VPVIFLEQPRGLVHGRVVLDGEPQRILHAKRASGGALVAGGQPARGQAEMLEAARERVE